MEPSAEPFHGWSDAVAMAHEELREIFDGFLDTVEYDSPEERRETLFALYRITLQDTHARCWPGESAPDPEFPWLESITMPVSIRDLPLREVVEGRIDPCLHHEKIVRRFIEFAKTDPIAFDALCDFAAACLVTRKTMNSALKEFAAAVLRRERRRPSGRGVPRVHPLRDWAIAGIVKMISNRFRVPATRNDVTEPRDSACDVVAEAMRELGRSPASYKSIKRIWLLNRH